MLIQGENKMLRLENHVDYKALGYKQELHGIPMYKILFSIIKLREQRHLATSRRIADLIGTYPNKINSLGSLYWQWNLVKKITIRNTKNKTRKANTRSVYHWDITTSGRKKLMALKAKYGGIVEIKSPGMQV